MPKKLKIKGMKKMDYILYLFIFAIGITFGSFYTLAIYRIPKTEDILHTHSYCPNCGHKLGFWDLIPLFSYAFLGGKCRYCGDKIRPRYFVIEFISGLFFIFLAYLLNIKTYNLTIYKIIDFSFIILYFTFVILMAGIDKEYRKIQREVTLYGIIIGIMYMIYLYIIDPTSIYRYGIYLICYAIFIILSNITLKKYAKNRYIYGILITITTMAIFTGIKVTVLTAIAVSLSILIYLLIKKVQNMHKTKRNDFYKDIRVGYILGISNISFLIYVLFQNQYLL